MCIGILLLLLSIHEEICIASSSIYVWLCPYWWRLRLFVAVTMGVDACVCPAWCVLWIWAETVSNVMGDSCIMGNMIISLLKAAGFVYKVMWRYAFSIANEHLFYLKSYETYFAVISSCIDDSVSHSHRQFSVIITYFRSCLDYYWERIFIPLFRHAYLSCYHFWH